MGTKNPTGITAEPQEATIQTVADHEVSTENLTPANTGGETSRQKEEIPASIVEEPVLMAVGDKRTYTGGYIHDSPDGDG